MIRPGLCGAVRTGRVDHTELTRNLPAKLAFWDPIGFAILDPPLAHSDQISCCSRKNRSSSGFRISVW
jgi:hypothetical protein